MKREVRSREIKYWGGKPQQARAQEYFVYSVPREINGGAE